MLSFSRINMQLIVCCLFVSLSVLLIASVTVAQTPQESLEPTEVVNEQALLDNSETLDSLQSIANSVQQARQTISSKQELLRSEAGSGREEELRSEIQEQSAHIEGLEQSFRQIAAGTNVSFLKGEAASKEFSLSTELANILRPIVRELQQLTAAPREIDSLRERIEEFSVYLATAENAAEQTRSYLAEVDESSPVAKLLEDSLEHWEQKRQEFSAQLEINQQQLRQRLSTQVPFTESFSDVFERFFKSRGRNLALALGLALGFFLLIRRTFDGLQSTALLHKKHFSHTNRLLVLAYIFASIFGSITIFLLVLFFSGDWLLLTLSILLLFSLIWASRDTLPRYSKQLALLLNVGPVREGERVVYQELPWLVDKIHMYSRLKNPELAGGVLRIPLADLCDLRSRKAAANEPYFPSRADDWVLLSNSVFGRVIVQSPEYVQILELGGAVHTFSTTEYLAQNPKCLSRGFRCLVSFGIDYQHQSESTELVPQTLANAVREKLSMREYSDAKIQVEFEGAGASSLNLAIIVDLPGKYACDFPKLERLLHRIAVDTCTKHAWVIPFDQLTLHVADQSEPPPRQRLDNPQSEELPQ